MKKILNQPESYVDEMLDGLVIAHGERSIGLDDPGMVPIQHMVAAI